MSGDLLVQSGKFEAERSTVDEGSCRTGEDGRRAQRSFILFDPPYREVPQVFVSLEAFDFAQNRNARFAAEAMDVSPYAMTLVVYTWCNTNMYVARGSYFVIGQPLESIDQEVDDWWNERR